MATMESAARSGSQSSSPPEGAVRPWEQIALPMVGWLFIAGGVVLALALGLSYQEPRYASEIARATAELTRIADGAPDPRFWHTVWSIAIGASVSFSGWLLLKFATALEWIGEVRWLLAQQQPKDGGDRT